MSSLAWMLTAFGCLGLGIAGYLASLLIRQRRIEDRLKTLRRHTDR